MKYVIIAVSFLIGILVLPSIVQAVDNAQEDTIIYGEDTIYEIEILDNTIDTLDVLGNPNLEWLYVLDNINNLSTKSYLYAFSEDYDGIFKYHYLETLYEFNYKILKFYDINDNGELVALTIYDNDLNVIELNNGDIYESINLMYDENGTVTEAYIYFIFDGEITIIDNSLPLLNLIPLVYVGVLISGLLVALRFTNKED